MLAELIQFFINSLRGAITRFFTWFRHENMIKDNTRQFPVTQLTPDIESQEIPLQNHQTLPLYNSTRIYNDKYPINCESYPITDSDDDGWNSDSDTLDPTIRYHSPNSPLWVTSQGYLETIAHLSDSEQINELYSCWLSKKLGPVEEMSEILHHLVASHRDPYSFTIAFVDRMKKIKMGRNSPVKLCLSVLEEVLQATPSNLLPILTQTHQLQAIEVGVLCQPSILDEMTRIYRIDSLSDEIKCKVMKELITSNQYKEAIVSITRFGLQPFFSVQELLPPLIGTDQINLIEAYIGCDRNLQIQFIMLLDKLCSPNTDYLKLYSYYRSSGFVRSDLTNNKLSEHQIKRLSGRLIKTYELDASLFVHFTTAKVSSFTTSLLHQYYFVRENVRQIHEKNWIDLLTASVAQREELQIHLVEELVRFNDYKIAKYFVNYFNLSKKIANQISTLLFNTTSFIPNSYRSTNRFRDDTKYHQLHLSFDSIQIIDTPAKLQKCQDYISRNGTVIGIDAEWLMPLCNFGILRLAILQLATKDFIFLLDMVALTGAVSQAQQVSFIKSLFHSSHTIKLGFAIDGDLKMLGRTWPCVARLLDNPLSTIDLQTVANNIKSKTNGTIKSHLQNTNTKLIESENQSLEGRSTAEVMSTQSLCQKTSLTSLIEECFGFPLDKSNQIANWEKRPIRDDMKVYAALDAFCLLELFDYFRSNFGDSIF